LAFCGCQPISHTDPGIFCGCISGTSEPETESTTQLCWLHASHPLQPALPSSTPVTLLALPSSTPVTRRGAALIVAPVTLHVCYAALPERAAWLDASHSLQPALPSSTPVTLPALPSSTSVTRRGAALVGTPVTLHVCYAALPLAVVRLLRLLTRRVGGWNSWDRRASCQTRRRSEVRRICRRAPARYCSSPSADLRNSEQRVQEPQMRSRNDAGARSFRILPWCYHNARHVVQRGLVPRSRGQLGATRPWRACV